MLNDSCLYAAVVAAAAAVAAVVLFSSLPPAPCGHRQWRQAQLTLSSFILFALFSFTRVQETIEPASLLEGQRECRHRSIGRNSWPVEAVVVVTAAVLIITNVTHSG